MDLDPSIIQGFHAALAAQEQHGLKPQTPNVDWPVIGLGHAPENCYYIDEATPLAPEELAQILERIKNQFNERGTP